MSPTDKGGNTPESNEIPEPNGEPTPNEAAPVEPINEAPAEPEAIEPETAQPETAQPETAQPESAAPQAAAPQAVAPEGATYGEAPVAGTPIGGEYPAPEAFASAQAAAPGNNKKVLAIIGAVVVAIAVVAVLLFVFLRGDSDSSPDAQIKQVTEDYVSAMNAGQLTKVPALLCEAQASQAPEGLADQPAPAQQVKINSFDEIKVDGDKATATFTISDKNDDSIPSEQVPMVYVNEDGWKLCQE